MDVVTILDKLIILVSELDNIVLGVTTILGGGMYLKNRTEKNQLIKTIDKSQMKNEDFLNLAKKEGLTWGMKALSQLFKAKK